MLDPVKMLKITQLVQNTSILNAQEKAEWLSLIGLMNDKQISELESILQSSSGSPVIPSANPVTKPSPVVEAQTPSLGHISNLPRQMNDPRLAPKPATPAMVPGPERDFARSSKLTPMQVPKKEPLSLLQTAPGPEGKSFTPTSEPRPHRPTISSPIISADVAAKGLKLLALSDIRHLTAEALHHQNRANFFTTISALAEKEGYFNILSLFEQSPLYQDYLNYGKLLLSGANSDNLPFTQEEFEFVADLLQALKINRV